METKMEEKIRKMVVKLLTELLDYKKIPDNLIINKNHFNFIRNDENYEVIFQDFSKNKSIALGLNNKEVKNAIKKSKKIFQVDFGVLDENRTLDTEKNTNSFDYEYVLGSISAIIEYFITENGVDVLTYFAEKKRRNVYRYIYNKYFKYDFFYFEKNEIKNDKYEIFFIKNDLLQ